MNRKINNYIAAALAALMLMSLFGCDSNKKTESELISDSTDNTVSEVNSESVNVSSSTDTMIIGNSAAESVLKNSNANGYTVCKIDGSSDSQIVLLYGDYEKKCQYEFYAVSNDDVDNIGSIDGSNITAYISDETNCLCICMNNSGKYTLGSVKYDGEGITVDWIETIMLEDKNAFPTLPGKKVEFLKIDDPKLIKGLNDAFSDNTAEESVELEE